MSKFQVNIDKKQLPQVAVLGVLSLGLLGYAACTLLKPGPATQAVASPAAPTAAVAAPAAKAIIAPQLSVLIGGAAPTASMHDPFVSCLPPPPAPAQQPVSAAPPAAPLPAVPLGPRLQALQPMPAAGFLRPLPDQAPVAAPAQPAPVAWTVTGVILGAGGHTIAVLRNNESHRYVELGHMVDGQFRLIGVDRYGVTLRDGPSRVRLMLGSVAPKPAGAPASSSAAAAPLPGLAAPTAPAALSGGTTSLPSAANTPSDKDLNSSSDLDPLTLN